MSEALLKILLLSHVSINTCHVFYLKCCFNIQKNVSKGNFAQIGRGQRFACLSIKEEKKILKQNICCLIAEVNSKTKYRYEENSKSYHTKWHRYQRSAWNRGSVMSHCHHNSSRHVPVWPGILCDCLLSSSSCIVTFLSLYSVWGKTEKRDT